jgi:hypothetical protein
LGFVGIDVKIILKWISLKCGVQVWTEFKWYRLEYVENGNQSADDVAVCILLIG